jgi:phosphodiesterase/alkaline phosphatase D-like protein
LQPDTLHHFRVVGQNGAGTVYGADQVFTTNASAPTVTTGAASQVGTSEATLNGIVNANGNPTTVTFEYGLDSSYGSSQVADQSPVSGTTDTAVSTTLSGLQPGETYHFRVVGENGVGITAGADATFAAARLAAIPTLNDLALLVFSILLMGAGVVAIRRGA